MAQKCKTGEVYDTKLKKCRRSVRRKNQAMGKYEKKAGEILTKIIKEANPIVASYKTFKFAYENPELVGFKKSKKKKKKK